MREPVCISLFHDVLCALCQVAWERVRRLEDEFGDLVEVELRPFPVRTDEVAPSERDVRRQVRLVQKASHEPEGALLQSTLWCGRDLPLSSLPPLLAAEAAREQGRSAQRTLLSRLRDAAFQGGINVARRDVIFELAATCALDMDRFAEAFDSPGTLRAVQDSRRQALVCGVRAVPALLIGGEWLVTGVRELHEYREVLLHWLQRSGQGATERLLH